MDSLRNGDRGEEAKNRALGSLIFRGLVEEEELQEDLKV